MKFVNAKQEVEIPEGVNVEVKSRVVTVSNGDRVLKRSFKHTALDMYKETRGEEGEEVEVVVIQSWMGSRKKNSVVRTIASHLNNMITGVTKGFAYKMRFVYAHFPVTVVISDDNSEIEIRNFLGQKKLRKVTMVPGVTIKFTAQKDEVIIEGDNLEDVSMCAGKIRTICKVRNKDIRKFLDGAFESWKGTAGRDGSEKTGKAI